MVPSAQTDGRTMTFSRYLMAIKELIAQTNVDIQESFQEAAPNSFVQERPQRRERVAPRE